MNEFRKRVLGERQPREPLLRNKSSRRIESRAAEEESFADLTIPRDAPRCSNHRDADRHRLASETARLFAANGEQQVDLVNVSGGGAMIEGARHLQLWDKIELQPGECGRLEAIVRWVRGERIGLEFAHETRIDADEDEVAATLRAVIARSFPDVVLQVEMEAEAEEDNEVSEVESADSDQAEREIRHPLIWTGLVHFNHESTPVRLRNISSGGAMVEAASSFPVGVDLLLDLGEAGAIFGTTHWARGDQAGMKFHAPYDLACLANTKPEVAPARWVAPDYLRDDRGGNSPWSSRWNRSDLGSLHRFLVGSSKIRRRF